MSFFDKLGKKANETLQFTKEKASNISGELKIRGKINDAKDKIEDLYKEIGEIVYSEMQAGTDVTKDDITVKCEEISKLKNDIEKLEVEILALKKIKKCEECSTELELEAEFCSKCGKKQPKIEKVEVEIKQENPEAKEAEVVEVKNVENEASDNKEEKVENTSEENIVENSEEKNEENDDEENKN